MKTIPAVIAIIVAVTPCLGVHAAAIEWNNSGPDWATGADWVGGTAPADSTLTDIAVFGSTGSPQVNPVLSANRSISGITFQPGAYSYTFSGADLTIGGDGIGSGAIFATETFSNSIATSTSQNWTNAGTLSVNGTLDLNGSGADARTLSLNGAGNTFLNGVVENSFAGSTGNLSYNGDANGSLTLANANTYDGLTTIASGVLHGAHDSAFGSSDVSLTGNAALLVLQSGLLNDYISNTATLSTANGGTISLNFVGTDVVRGFVIDGIAQPIGAYNSVNKPGLLSGTGSITVVPLPSGAVLLLSALGGLAGIRRKRAGNR